MWTAFAEYMYQSALCLVAHKDQQIGGLHPSLLAAATLASLQDLHLCWQSRISVHFLSLSVSSVLFRVVLRLPLFLLPSCVQERAMLQSLVIVVFFGLKTSIFCILFLGSVVGLMFDSRNISCVVIWSCHCILRFRLRLLLWNTSILFSSPLFIFHIHTLALKWLVSYTLILFLFSWWCCWRSISSDYKRCFWNAYLSILHAFSLLWNNCTKVYKPVHIF